MSAILERVRKTKEEIAAKRKKLLKDIKILFGEASKELFDQHPNLHQFGWAQYTPYFNDGDECIFEANTDYLDVNWSGEWNEKDAEELAEIAKEKGIKELKDIHELGSAKHWDGNNWVDKDPDPQAKETLDSLKSFLKEFNDDDFKDMFGDHCQISVTRKGVEVEEYEHD